MSRPPSARHHIGRRRVAVHVLHEDGLREGRLVVLARAALAVPARPDLEVERAVHLGEAGRGRGKGRSERRRAAGGLGAISIQWAPQRKDRKFLG